MKRKTLALLLVLVMVMLSFGACGGTDQKEGVATEGGEDGVYTLEVNYFASGQNTIGVSCARACEEATERSDGRLQFVNYYDGTYVSYGETIPATIDGVVDISYVYAGNINEVFPLNSVLSMPVNVALPDRYVIQDALEALLVECPEIDQELQDAGLTWIGISDMGASMLHLVGDLDVRVPKDMKGLIIDAPASAGTLMKTYGASPTILEPNDYYTSFERGVVNGIWHNWGMLDVFALTEVTHTHIMFDENDRHAGLWAPVGGWIMNLDSYNSLPEDLQQIIKEVFSEFGDNWADLDFEAADKAFKESQDAGHKFIYLTEDEVAQWEEAIATTNKEILSNLDAKGVPATTVYNKYCEILTEMNQ